MIFELFFLFFFEVDNFNFFSFFVWLPRRRKKKVILFSLFGFVWLLRNEFFEGKMKGKNRKSDF